MLTLNNNNPFRASLSHHGSFGGVAQARYEHGEEAVCFVTYVTVGSDFVITSFGVNPKAIQDAQLACDAIDNVLESEAHKLGINRLFIVVPNCDEAKFVRTYELQPFTMGFGCFDTTPSPKFLN